MEWPKELKKTQPRKFVLGILEKAREPLTAMEIHRKMEILGEKVWLSTIYRTLELFEEYNLIIKNPVSNGEVSVYMLKNHDHTHYAQCISCNKVFSLQSCPLEEFQPKIEGGDFQIIDHRMEFFGYCTKCK